MSVGGMFTVSTHSVDETKAFGRALGAVLDAGSTVLFAGDLGVGKTQCAQGIGEGIGVKSPMTSPTFNLVFEYREGRVPLYHFDLYRLESPDQLEDIDFYALTDESSDGVSLVEWAERFPEEMPEDHLSIEIVHMAGESDGRSLTVSATGPTSRSALEDLRAAWMHGGE